MFENTLTTITLCTRTESLRKTVFQILDATGDNGLLSKLVDYFLISLISISVLAVMLESIAAVEAKYRNCFFWLEIITVSIFTLEYLLRVWCCVENGKYKEKSVNGIIARLRFMLSPYALIDIVAILPFYLLLFGTFTNVDMRFLRAVRLLRILKLTRYSSAFDMLANACTENMRSLAAAFFILITVMLLAASGIYFFERESQPVAFGSIPAAMWWAFATLTTVGYGDVTPITVGGRIFGSLITVIGVGMVALPTGIIASGYAHEIKLRSKKFEAKAVEALEDGILSDSEISRLNECREELGISKHTASQIIDTEKVNRVLNDNGAQQYCPQCGAPGLGK